MNNGTSSPGFWSLLLAAVPPTLVALGSLIAALGALRESKKIVKKADAIVQTTGVIVEKTEKIHDTTNSNYTGLKNDLKLANERIEGMEKLIRSQADAKKAADAVALAAARPPERS